MQSVPQVSFSFISIIVISENPHFRFKPERGRTIYVMYDDQLFQSKK